MPDLSISLFKTPPWLPTGLKMKSVNCYGHTAQQSLAIPMPTYLQQLQLQN